MASKDSNELVSSPAATVADREVPLSLEEFCTRLSASDKRVEMIGAFHYVENKNDRQQDTETAFRARFEAFVNEPA